MFRAFRVPPRQTVRLVGVLVLAAGLFASGCGQAKAGAAALVGDQRIAVNQLSQSVDATEHAAKQKQLRVTDRAGLVRGVLSRQILSRVLDEAARRKGVTVTRGDVDQQIAEAGGRKRLESQALRSAVPPSELREYVRDHVIQQRLTESLDGNGGAKAQQRALLGYLRKVARDMGVTVSPRYGHFNTKQLTVAPSKSDLSTPDPDESQGGTGLAGAGSSGRG